MTNTSATRSQVGIGTLVIFVSMVLVASIAAGVLINTVGIQLGGDGSSDAGETPATDRLLVIERTGAAVEDGSVGAVNLTVAVGPDAADVDLRDATVTWIGPNGAYNVANRRAEGGSSDGTFAVTAVRDPSDSAPVVDEVDDRMVLTFDLEADDVAGVDEFGSRLGPGDMVSVTVTTGDGESTTTRLSVPRSSSGTDPLVL